MRRLRCYLAWVLFSSLAGAVALSQVPPPPSGELALVGGTLVDVTSWGRSAKDIPDSVVLIAEGKILATGSRAEITIPKTARVIDCTGKYLIPGLVDGYAGMNAQGQADAFLAMGVTTVVAASDARRGHVDLFAGPRPHLYLLDSIGTTDDFSLLIGQRDWASRLRESGRPAQLSPADIARQLEDTARLGTRVLRIGPNITAANTQWIIAKAHQQGIVTYGEFVSTPYSVGIEAGVDALFHMGRYELGVIPDELQRPLAEDPWGTAANTAYDYAEHLPLVDLHLRTYARFLASHHAALMPAFSTYFLHLPGHRNLWQEPVAPLLNPAGLYNPPDRTTGELTYPLSSWARRLPGSAQRWLIENQRKKADQEAMHLWQINQVLYAAGPRYLVGSGASVDGSMPGISEHVELEMLVRLGLSPREAIAAATNNFALQFGWNELGLIAPGRRADLVILDSDPTLSIWNVRRISAVLLDGAFVDREALLRPRR